MRRSRFFYLLGEPVMLLLALVAANWTLYLFAARRIDWIRAHVVEINTALFLYIPLLALLLERFWPDEPEPFSIDDYGLDPGRILRALGVFAVTMAIVAPLFTAAFYLASRYGPSAYHPRFDPHVPEKLLDIAWFHLVHVALPEEFFFRGYVQARLDRAFGGRVRLLGAQVGWSIVVTSLLFAVTHPLLGTSLWSLDTFFPGLLFGWLRSRTGSLAAPVAMHWTSNLLLFSLAG